MENDKVRSVHIQVTGKPEFFGSIPARTDILVLPPDELSREPVGWKIIEFEGIAICNGYAVLPWYRKIFRARFWRGMREKLFPPR